MAPKKNGGMQVINASYNKTGTKTIHTALEILGHVVNDCQENVYDHWEDYTDLWNGEDPEKVFTKIFGKNNKWGYTATCDIPGNTYWETLTEIFPEAKVILCIRDEDKWIDSLEKFMKTEQTDFLEMRWHRLYNNLYRFIFPHTSGPMRVYMDYLRPAQLGPEPLKFDGYNKLALIRNYRYHNSYVLNKCPKEKLLIYKLGDGWEPICKFLDCPIPKEDFPWSNRGASVIAELTQHPSYIRAMKRQFLCFAIRIAMIAAAVYFYRNPCDCINETLDETWKKVGAALLAAFIFHKA